MKRPPPIRYFVGVDLAKRRRDVFAVRGDLKAKTVRGRYGVVVGPFGNVRAAHYVARYGVKEARFRCPEDLDKVCKSRPVSGRKRLELPPSETSRRHAGGAGERPYDLLDRVLDEVGGVPRKPRGAAGKRLSDLFAGYDEARHAGVLKILPPAQTRPDEVASALNLDTAEDMWLALAKAAKARRGERSGAKTGLASLSERGEREEDFTRSASCEAQFGAGKRRLRPKALNVGDTFKVSGEPFTVIGFDDSTGEVITKGGTRFGEQAFPVSFDLCIDPGSHKRAKRTEAQPF